MKSIFLFLVLIFSISSCKKGEASAEDSVSGTEIMAVKLPPPPPPRADIVASADAKMNSPKKEDSQTIEQKIIKNGNLRFETNDLTATYNQIQSAVKSHNATIQNDTEGKDYGSVFRRLTIRVPSQNFDSFIKNISIGISYFDNKEISSQDVTEQYIDLDARLKAKKKLESRYLELLAKATKVSEILAIEQQLSIIREEIESKEGQLKYLQSQVSLSTVTIEFYKTVAEERGITISYGAKIWNAIQSGFFGISSFFLGLLQVWPFIIILVTGIYFIRKRFKKKNQ